MSTYKRIRGRQHEHGFEDSCRARVHDHLGGGTKHDHDWTTGAMLHMQPVPEGLDPVLYDKQVRLTPRESAAIAILQYLGTIWPRSLTLIRMDSGLHVMRTGDLRFEGDRTPDQRAQVIIANIDGIENNGGEW